MAKKVRPKHVRELTDNKKKCCATVGIEL